MEIAPFVTAIEDLWQALFIVPGLEAQVGPLVIGLAFVPGGVYKGLAQQRDGTHQRRGVALRGGAFVQRIMCGGSLFDDDEVLVTVCKGNHYPCSPRDAVLHVGET